MTEPAAEGGSETADSSGQADSKPAVEKQSLWGRLNRTNRIAALVLGGVAAVVVALLIFGAGLFVGAEYGDSEGHDGGAGTSEHGDGEWASGEHGGDDGGYADEGERDCSDQTGARGESEHRRSEAPDGQAPSETTRAPRP